MTVDADTDDIPALEVMTPAEELKSLAVILKRAERLSPVSQRWLIAHLEADSDGGTSHA